MISDPNPRRPRTVPCRVQAPRCAARDRRTDRMDRTRSRFALVGATTVALLLGAQVVSAGPGAMILEAQTMVGVPAGLTGAQSEVPLRGINGGGLPWTLTSGKAE